MKTPLALFLILAGPVLLSVGCIHHEETVYRDAPRTSIEFENDKAARIFYEAFHERANKADHSESTTELDLPIVFHNKRHVVSGPNTAFNRAVEICDANHDGRISEQEARIYGEHKR